MKILTTKGLNKLNKRHPVRNSSIAKTTSNTKYCSTKPYQGRSSSLKYGSNFTIKYGAISQTIIISLATYKLILSSPEPP